MTNEKWLQSWKDYYDEYKCMCGAEKLNLGEYGHAQWCKKYKQPIITNNCNCSYLSIGWHSPGCRYRIWPIEEKKSELPKVDLRKLSQEWNKK